MGVALSRYREALDFLFARTTGKTRFGLARTRELLRALGDPQTRLAAFHVAGTNGKGSVCASIEAVLRERGLRVGKYTSPHLVDFRERILVDGIPMPEEAVVEFVERWTPFCERIGATFFEATTAMAFDYLARADVDAAVVEVGLGGRLDSTNVISPVVAGVVSIGLDHLEYLGDTREAIADEKAGIFKAGVPAVVGEPDAAIRTRLAAHARAVGASCVRVVAEETSVSDVTIGSAGTAFTLSAGGHSRRLRTTLTGAHQAANATVALTMLDAAGAPFTQPPDLVERALRQVRLPGRFHREGRFIFDVAHNPDGAAVLASTLAAAHPGRPLVALVSVLGDKDWRSMLDTLAPQVDAFVLTSAPTAPASRAWVVGDALAHAQHRGWDARAEPDFDRAIELALAAGAAVLVTGSFHTVGDAMARLQINPLGG